MESDYLERDPASVLRSPKQREALPDIIDRAELSRLLSMPSHKGVWSRLHAGKRERDQLLLALFAYGGLRHAELLGLDWDDVDLERRVVRVRHAKGGRHRAVPIHPGLVPLFLASQRAITSTPPTASELGARRVLIVDWDVHHGNGTAEAFRRRSDVLFVSIHQAGIYPGTGSLSDVGSGAGEGYTVNLPVPAGSEQEQWLSLLEHIVIPVAESFAPELVLISAGFDAHREDPLAGCRLEASSFAEMARHVRALAVSLGVPLGAVLEGGYQPAALAECVRETLAALTSDEPAQSAAPEPLLTSRAAAHAGHYWPL